MWVQVLQPFGQLGRQYVPDDVVNIGDQLAQEQIAAGRARYMSFEDVIISNTERIITLENERLRWLGDQSIGDTYLRNDMVLAGNVLTVANKTTTDDAGIRFIDDDTYLLPDAPTWTSGQIAASSLSWANQYTLSATCFASEIRVWVPSDSADIMYRVSIIDETNPDAPITQTGDPFSGASVGIGWKSAFTQSQIFLPGQVITIVVETWNTVGQVDTVANYNYLTPNNVTAPGVGVMNQADKDTSRLHVNKTDYDAGDQTAMLQSLVAGDQITDGFLLWAISDPVENAANIDYGVSPEIQSTDGIKPITFTHFAVQPVDYVYLPDYWAGQTNPYISNATGYVKVAEDEPVQTDEAYGIDIKIGGVVHSEDWDLMATFVADSISGATSRSASRQPFFFVTHYPDVDYPGVDTAPVIVGDWDAEKTVEQGGLDWGDVPDHATIPEGGTYRVQANFTVTSGANNTTVGVQFMLNRAGDISQIGYSEVLIGRDVPEQLSISEYPILATDDLIFIEMYTDDGTGVDVTVNQGYASATLQYN